MPQKPTACLALADGTVFYGHGFGATGEVVAELVFNTAMTGYQEIMTDPSYASQIVTFTFPHIGNIGANKEDIYHATADAMNRSLGLPQGERRTVFDDGTYRVQVGRLFAVIARRDGAEFYVPTHHAWFDRVATADCRRTVEDLHTELVTTTA